LLKRPDLLERALEEPCDPLWRLDDHGFEPALEDEVESRFTVANGFLGVRGSLELPTPASRPRTFIAGLFDRSPLKSAVPSLVSAPDWLGMRVLVNGKALHEPSRCSDDDLYTVTQGSKLPVNRLTTVDWHEAYPAVAAKLTELLGDLHRELARGREDNGLWDVTLDVYSLDQGDAEGGCLARAGERLGDEVAPFEQGWDCLYLDRCRLLKPHIVQASQDRCR